MNLAGRQRKELLALMHTLGPLAPTACEGWLVQDLAAHLWIREHKLRALPGIGLARFAATTERLQMEALHSLGFDRLLSELSRPCGLIGLLDPLVNAPEYYIHHEDVLRPMGERAELTDNDQRFLFCIALILAGITQRKLKSRLVVAPTIGKTKSLGTGSPVVYVEGKPNELLLHFSGRDADVTVTADDPEAYRSLLTGI